METLGNASSRMIIIIDTREQSPWTFEGVETKRLALPAGDYSLERATQSVAIERKTLHDFVNTVIHNRERFHRECVLLSQMPHACVIVEASIEDVKMHNYKSRAKPGSVLAIAEGIERKYRLPIIWAKNRFGAIVRAREWLEIGYNKFTV